MSDRFLTEQERIDNLTMKIDNPNIVGSGYIPLPPQKRFERPLMLQPPTISHLEFPEEYSDYTMNNGQAAKPPSGPPTNPQPAGARVVTVPHPNHVSNQSRQPIPYGTTPANGGPSGVRGPLNGYSRPEVNHPQSTYRPPHSNGGVPHYAPAPRPAAPAQGYPGPCAPAPHAAAHGYPGARPVGPIGPRPVYPATRPQGVVTVATSSAGMIGGHRAAPGPGPQRGPPGAAPQRVAPVPTRVPHHHHPPGAHTATPSAVVNTASVSTRSVPAAAHGHATLNKPPHQQEAAKTLATDLANKIAIDSDDEDDDKGGSMSKAQKKRMRKKLREQGAKK